MSEGGSIIVKVGLTPFDLGFKQITGLFALGFRKWARGGFDGAGVGFGLILVTRVYLV